MIVKDARYNRKNNIKMFKDICYIYKIRYLICYFIVDQRGYNTSYMLHLKTKMSEVAALIRPTVILE